MRWLAILLVALAARPAVAAELIVKDGDTLQIGATTYKLDGIDAPEYDQTCVDDHADPWACGVEARDKLVELIGNRDVHCDDLGPSPVYGKWHAGLCRIEGESESLNAQIVRSGYAVNARPSVKGHFEAEEASARNQQKGLWRGCFAAPREFRQHVTDGVLLGVSCRGDKDAELRAALFPDEPTMPPRCAIKAKFAVRARITGNVGVYQLQGCPSYASLTKPSRWFCSEEDAQAAGFRRAYNCRAGMRAR